MNALNEALTDVREAAATEATETVAAVIEHAQADIEAAQASAAAIARAAMETELGRRIASNEQEISTWQEKLSLLTNQITAVMTEMTEIKTTVAASLTLQVATQNPPANPALALQTLPNSEILQAVETVTEALPGNLSENAVAESPVPEIPKGPRKLFL